MAVDDSLTLADVKQKIETHLKSTEYVDKFIITFSKLDKLNDQKIWRLNIEYIDEGTDKKNFALIALEAKSGKITTFERGKGWVS
jgi:hypothetical protein